MKRFKDFLFPVVVVVGVAVFALSGRSPATGMDYTYEAKPEIIAATFSSAWCSSCKVLEPKLADVVPEFADRPVKFVKLNFTFGQGPEQERQAKEHNFFGVYERFKGGTGFTLLIDAESGEVIDMLTMKHSKEAMRVVIAQAIALASRENEAINP